ncbi:hypothetical protein [Pedobacter frigoris]|uniref:Cell wall anchor protein n=1 Tax=Pedobacter frigoris TaxID=2571272 RepID=A0A4U1CFC3_9SPHI|nr:hypothetical protein [Pedobacter frigoris]TKC05240.1 hypothetical protein FA047_15910 [Pedobacter frigoris]
MKKSLVTLVLGLVCSGAFSQTNTFPASGNVGVGTTTPTQKLTVVGNINIEDPTAGKYLAFGKPLDNEYNTIGSLYSSAGFTISHGLKPHPSQAKLVYSFPTMSRSAIMVGGFSENGINFYTQQSSEKTMGDSFDDSPRMLIRNDGNVGIGTTIPNAKLAVNGNIRAKEIKVETANWPDYVFLPSYKVPTLQEIEKHIKDHGHLPGIPSASEVKANGVDLGDMNAKLLQKIEELTLHLIEQNKTLEHQNKQIEHQNNKIESQNKDLQDLKTEVKQLKSNKK